MDMELSEIVYQLHDRGARIAMMTVKCGDL